MYGGYQELDSKWMRTIPEHWETKRIKAIFRMRKEKNNPVITDNILSLSAKQGVVPYAEKEDAGGNKPKDNLSLYNICREGDLLVNCMNIVSGAAGVSKYFGAISPVYYPLYPRDDINVWFYHYVFRLLTFQRSLIGLGKGILMHESETGTLTTVRMRISMDRLGSVLLPVPPRNEQDQIVRYLDWQVSKVNSLIKTKKKQIALLDELQRSLICSLVVNGVHADCKKRESGINWAEYIPENWDVLYLSQVTNERSIKNAGLKEKNLLSLSYGHIVNKDINTTEGLLPASFEGYQIVLPDNIVLRLTDLQNDHRSLRVGLSTQKGIITSAYTCLNVHENILPEYLYFQLHAADLCKVFYGIGGGVRQSIGYKDIRKMLIAVPPIEEQKLIIEKIQENRLPTEKVIEKLNYEITVLEELKQRIVADVVTGQLDVRNIEIPEYEFVEEAPDDSDGDEENGEFTEQEEE